MDILTQIPSQITIIIFLTLCGLFLRFSLVYCGQYWANTYHHLATYMILPNIAYVITTVIANNIALSLGMIGALSIVRFRHPVRSPFELTIFFALITIGISASVNAKYAFLLIALSFVIIVGIFLFQKLFKNFGSSLFQPSFSEGSSKNMINLQTKGIIEEIEKSKNLSNSFYSNETNISEYNLLFENRDEAQKFIENYRSSDLIISCRSSFED